MISWSHLAYTKSMLHVVEMFILIFLFSYLALTLLVKLKHYITKDKSKAYRLAVLIFSLGLALMVAYWSLGR